MRALDFTSEMCTSEITLTDECLNESTTSLCVAAWKMISPQICLAKAEKEETQFLWVKIVLSKEVRRRINACIDTAEDCSVIRSLFEKVNNVIPDVSLGRSHFFLPDRTLDTPTGKRCRRLCVWLNRLVIRNCKLTVNLFICSACIFHDSLVHGSTFAFSVLQGSTPIHVQNDNSLKYFCYPNKPKGRSGGDAFVTNNGAMILR